LTLITETAVNKIKNINTQEKSLLIFLFTSILMARTSFYDIPLITHAADCNYVMGISRIIFNFLTQSANIYGQCIGVNVFFITVPESAQYLFRREDQIRIFHKQ